MDLRNNSPSCTRPRCSLGRAPNPAVAPFSIKVGRLSQLASRPRESQPRAMHQLKLGSGLSWPCAFALADSKPGLAWPRSPGEVASTGRAAYWPRWHPSAPRRQAAVTIGHSARTSEEPAFNVALMALDLGRVINLTWHEQTWQQHNNMNHQDDPKAEPIGQAQKNKLPATAQPLAAKSGFKKAT